MVSKLCSKVLASFFNCLFCKERFEILLLVNSFLNRALSRKRRQASKFNCLALSFLSLISCLSFDRSFGSFAKWAIGLPLFSKLIDAKFSSLQSSLLSV